MDERGKSENLCFCNHGLMQFKKTKERFVKLFPFRARPSTINFPLNTFQFPHRRFQRFIFFCTTKPQYPVVFAGPVKSGYGDGGDAVMRNEFFGELEIADFADLPVRINLEITAVRF